MAGTNGSPATSHSSPTLSSNASQGETPLAPPQSRANTLAGINITFYVHFKLDLGGVNYSMWRQEMEMAIGLHGVDEHITADFDDHQGDREWKRINLIVKSWIYTTCKPDFLQLIMDSNATAFAIWSTVETMFTGNVRSRQVKLLSELHDLRQGSSSIAAYGSKLQRIAHGLRDIKKPLDDADLVVYFLRGLDQRHLTARQLIEDKERLPPFQAVQATLQLDEDRQGGRPILEPNANAVLYSQATGSHGGQGSYGPNNGSPSPQQGKQKRKRTDKHTGYTPVRAPVPLGLTNSNANVAGLHPFHAGVHLGMQPIRGAPGILGSRPYAPSARAFSAFAPLQYGTPTANPFQMPWRPELQQAYDDQQQLYWSHPQSQQTSQHPSPNNTVEQAGLMHALHNLSLQNSTNGWVADSGATAHMATDHGSSHQGAAPPH